MSFLSFLFGILITNNFIEDLINEGIIIPIVAAIVGTIVAILIKYIYSKLSKNKQTSSSDKRYRKGGM
ncbi:MAG: hypothetical protein JW891_13355 [Candidatus Lokiarchaeota archaeon]|nr:hypothetical protein [Candidatus Lokiarchaeota archaeon]